MEIQRKYHPLHDNQPSYPNSPSFSPSQHSQRQAIDLVNCILYNTEIQLFQKNAVHIYKHEMAKQIITAQNQSMEQIRSVIPDTPYKNSQEFKPIKGALDTIRPYSARVQRIKKTINQTDSLRTTNRIYKRTDSLKNLKNATITNSYRSIPNSNTNSNNNISPKTRTKQQKSEYSKYKNRPIPLRDSRQNQQCDKIIEQLRKNKLKAQQYQKSKQNFLLSIAKQNQQYPKKQSKFVNTMTRKDYTYTYDCKIIQIPKQKQVIKKKVFNGFKNTLGTLPKKDQNQGQKSQKINVEFAKKQPRLELKEYIFSNGTDNKLDNLCPLNTYSTKFTLLVQDC